MIYSFSISTAANTPETAKQKTVLELERGRIYKVEFYFPPGPSGLLHLQVARGSHQVWPKNADADFSSDSDIIDFPDEVDILEAPYQLEAYTWNEDTDFAHTVIIRIGIRSLKAVTLDLSVPEVI